jgi:hypothetical protein
MSDEFDPLKYRWSWLLLVVFLVAALFAALWSFTTAARAKQRHQHQVPPPAVVSTNRN